MKMCTVLAAIAALAAGNTARAEDERLETEQPADATGNRTLGGHSFVPFSTVKWAFVETRFSSNTSVGLVQVPMAAEIGEQAFSGDADFATLGEEFTLELGFTKWIGLEIALLGTVVGGINDLGGLVVGFNAGFGGRLSLLFRLFETGPFYLGLRLEGSGLRTDGIIPQRLVVVNDGAVRVDTGRLRAQGEIGRGGASLAFSAAATEWLGFQMSATGEVLNVDFGEASDTTWLVSGAAGATLSFTSVGVPIALLVGGRIDHEFDDDVGIIGLPFVERVQSTTGDLEAGIYFAGRDDFDLGLAGVVGIGGDVDRFFGSIRLNYYW